jgi:hypothetical protein
MTAPYPPKLSSEGMGEAGPLRVQGTIGGLTFLKTDSELRAHSAKAITKCSGRSADSHSATAESNQIQKNYLDWLLSPGSLTRLSPNGGLDIDDKANTAEGFATKNRNPLIKTKLLGERKMPQIFSLIEGSDNSEIKRKTEEKRFKEN